MAYGKVLKSGGFSHQIAISGGKKPNKSKSQW
jgi:hypothetical protein